MARKIACLALVLLLAANALLYAQEPTIPASRWKKVKAERPGTPIIITLRSGKQVECYLKALSEKAIIVLVPEAREWEIPKVDIQNFKPVEHRNVPSWNGIRGGLMTRIIVTLYDGKKVECFLKAVTRDGIAVFTTDTKEREIPKTDVREIVTQEKRSGPLWNGALIGAAVGGAVVGGTYLINPKQGFGEAEGQAIIGIVGITTLLGMSYDAANKGQITLYREKASKK
jgi:hypothetical protein